MGKDIGTGMISHINRMEAVSIDDLSLALMENNEREVNKARAKNQEDKARAIEDKYEAIMVLINSMGEQNRTIKHLCEIITSLFESKDNAIVLGSIHKVKGAEYKNVFWLNRSQCPARWVKQDWQHEQERNLCYVATTRAKENLYLIEEQKRR